MTRLLLISFAAALVFAFATPAWAANEEKPPAEGLPEETKERTETAAADAPAPAAKPTRPMEIDNTGYMVSKEVRAYSSPTTLASDPALRDPLATGRNYGFHAVLGVPDAEGGVTMPEGAIDFRVGVTFDMFRDSGTSANYTETGFRLAGSPAEGLELRGFVAIGSWTGDVTSPLGFGVKTGEAMTDPIVSAKYRLMNGTNSATPVFLSLIVSLKMPLGSPADFTSSGKRDLAGVLATTILSGDLTINADFGAVATREATFLPPSERRTLFTYSASVWYATSGSTAFGVQFEGNTGYVGKRPAELIFGFRTISESSGFRGSKLIYEGGVGIPLSEASSDTSVIFRIRMAM
jgi:hypothetical protein